MSLGWGSARLRKALIESAPVVGAKIFGNALPGSNPNSLRTGLKMLKRFKIGPKLMEWYPMSDYKRKDIEPYVSEQTESSWERTDVRARKGKTITRKGQGKKAKAKAKIATKSPTPAK
eukprot:TRINITY_DN352_c0_g1_i1.p2 TRINITY_DN352_c0_g1~~TRINITY_DN352_c0_g1_i1.p2  ORF type:complete len:118 (+),score=48.98 TRINITY_DN352_c0_g1_i1:107-460(+)